MVVLRSASTSTREMGNTNPEASGEHVVGSEHLKSSVGQEREHARVTTWGGMCSCVL